LWYDGVTITDAVGSATVNLPDYFEALKRDFHYQLTVIGQFAPAIVMQEIRNNQFLIKTDKPNVKFSWQVTGIRQDAYAKAHPFEAERDKSEAERGLYLSPTEMGMPEERSMYIPGKRLIRPATRRVPLLRSSVVWPFWFFGPAKLTDGSLHSSNHCQPSLPPTLQLGQ
jgi:hypothetical protein